jgi:hypothetical protein
VFNASSVFDLEVVLLEEHLPTGVLPVQVTRIHQPLKRLVIGDQAELDPMQMLSEHPDSPSESKELPLVARVVALVLVK